jgi:opine dehydrogenase
MNTIERAVVLGSGAGALTIAAELGLEGVEVTLADLPEFRDRLQPIEETGGVAISYRDQPERATEHAPIAATSADVASAIAGFPLIIVSVPSFGHRPFAELLAPSLADGQTLMWVGEGGGGFATIAALRNADRRPAIRLAETNTLPYNGSLVEGPGRVSTIHKIGGTYVAGLPSGITGEVAQTASRIWPWVEAATNAWETVLVNYNAIDHVATVVANLGSLQSRSDTMLLWGEGASMGVANVIQAVDGDYLALRGALGLPTELRYHDYLIRQGVAAAKAETLYDTIHSSDLAKARFQCGPRALEHRYIAEDVPYSLVLASMA